MKTKLFCILFACSTIIACGDDAQNCSDGDISGTLDSSISGTTYFCGIVKVSEGFSIKDGTTLIIRPGTTVEFNEMKGIDTSFVENFSLLAEGTTANPIILRADSANEWLGIHLSDGSSSVLRNVTIDGVRKSDVAIEGDNMVLADVTIQNSGTGVKSAAFGPGSRNLRVIDSTGPFANLTSPAALRDFPGTETNAVDNAVVVDFTGLDDIDADIEFNLPMTYRVIYPIDTAGDLKVAPGVHIDGDNVMISAAARKLLGTEEAPISLTGSGYIQASSGVDPHDIILQWVNADHWEMDFESPVLLQHTKFSNCERTCFSGRSYFKSESDDVMIESMAESADAQFLMELEMDAISTLPGNLTLPDDSSARIHILWSFASLNGGLPNLGVTYYADGEISNKPGVSVWFAPYVTIEFGTQGFISLKGGQFQAEDVEMKAENSTWLGTIFENMQPGSYIRDSTISGTKEASVSTDGSMELTGNTLKGEYYCVETVTADATDYSANNEMDCLSGDIKVR